MVELIVSFRFIKLSPPPPIPTMHFFESPLYKDGIFIESTLLTSRIPVKRLPLYQIHSFKGSESSLLDDGINIESPLSNDNIIIKLSLSNDDTSYESTLSDNGIFTESIL